MLDIDDLIAKLDQYKPLQTYAFGHTPVQITHFKTMQQNGSELFEYWHHVLQLRTLRDSLEEMELQRDDIQHEITVCEKIWPFWNFSERQRKIPRLIFQLRKINRTLVEKAREAKTHYDILKTQYSKFEDLREEEILEQDKEYWAHRLGKQLATSRMSRALGVGEGELAAVLSLPKEEQQKILQSMAHSIEDSMLLPSNKSV
jgi:hypothetical protein